MQGIGLYSSGAGQLPFISFNIRVIVSKELLEEESLAKLLGSTLPEQFTDKEEVFDFTKKENKLGICVNVNFPENFSKNSKETGSKNIVGFTSQKENSFDVVNNPSDAILNCLTLPNEISEPKNFTINSSLSEQNLAVSQDRKTHQKNISKSKRRPFNKNSYRRRVRRKLRRISLLIAQAWRENKSPKTSSILKKVINRPEVSHLEVTRSLFGKDPCGKKSNKKLKVDET